MKYQIRNGKELSEKEYIAYLEGLAEGIWITSVELGDGDYHSKSYDPLYINSPGDVASYVFDFHDGGRRHSFKKLEDIYEGLIKEIEIRKSYEKNLF